MITKIKVGIANLIWKVCQKSPDWGNLVMDFIGYDNYCKVAKLQTITKRRS